MFTCTLYILSLSPIALSPKYSHGSNDPHQFEQEQPKLYLLVHLYLLPPVADEYVFWQQCCSKYYLPNSKHYFITTIYDSFMSSSSSQISGTYSLLNLLCHSINLPVTNYMPLYLPCHSIESVHSHLHHGSPPRNIPSNYFCLLCILCHSCHSC